MKWVIFLHGWIAMTYDRTRPKYKYVAMTSRGRELLRSLVQAVNEDERFPYNLSGLQPEELAHFLH
ncbi:hypothetical protein ACFFK0_07575 [Paenibacillus chartarius]|uniref:Uncharacterized protein n=1 Tax=Paenibacillus chartarius TaxID=747481 RepID=A0ABV6DI45_9BACL